MAWQKVDLLSHSLFLLARHTFCVASLVKIILFRRKNYTVPCISKSCLAILKLIRLFAILSEQVSYFLFDGFYVGE